MRLDCRGVLFDCDGVLVDSTDAGERAWGRWAREYGLDPARVTEGIHGRRSPETVALFLPAAERERGLRRIEEIEIGLADGAAPIPGAPELLAALPPVWAIVTSASPALVGARLAAAGLPWPEIVVTGEDVPAGKPAPDGYLRAAARLGLPAAACVVVEDSPAGVRAGRVAGAAAVLGVGERALVTPAAPVVRDLTGVTWAGIGLVLAPAGILRPGNPTKEETPC
ncbi:HAD-IA family hydrolase [Pseudonocardia xishanensis]|uniref:HAD family hydrolase n=1 Tax=Pseudonocardia xishanensis TaxID=630995 RepID=A0ABP8RES3_9PSEU